MTEGTLSEIFFSAQMSQISSWLLNYKFYAVIVLLLAAFSILLLDPSLRDAVETFWDRTFGFQLDRPSPFSIWGWGARRDRT